MPLSVDGRSKTLGFSLVELLVVIVIIGVISSVLVVSIRTTGNQERARSALSELGELWNAACEDSAITNRSHGLALGLNSYELLRLTPGGAWLRAEGLSRAAPTQLVGGLQFRLSTDGIAIDLEPEVSQAPKLLCYGGEVSPFELSLIDAEQGTPVASLRGDELGELAVSVASAQP